MYYIENRKGERIAEAEESYEAAEILSDLCTDEDFAEQEGKFREYNSSLELGDERAIVWQRDDETEVVVGYFGHE